MLDDICQRVAYMRKKAASRDDRMQLITQVRRGDLEQVDPESISDLFPRPVVSNMVNNAAEDFVHAMSDLPALNCSSGAMRSQADKNRASVKNKVGNNYWTRSLLRVSMAQAADHYDSYGFAVFYVEPDFDSKIPHISVRSSVGSYYLKNRRGRVIAYAQVWREDMGRLQAQFPEVALFRNSYGLDEQVEVTQYCDDKVIMLYASRNGDSAPLVQYNNVLGKCPVAVARRPALDEEDRGRYDDAVGPYLALNRMKTYLIEATEKAVHAPIQIGFDVQELPVGPDAVIQSDQPVQRVGIDVPQGAYATIEGMAQEVRVAAKHPDARDGISSASVVTGRGVEALMGAFDGQIKAAQIMLGDALSRITELAFEVDEKYFGSTEKEIQGVLSGESYAFTYLPRSAIAGNYTCAVDYGFASGLNPTQGVVMMLQLQGAKWISKDTAQRNLPFGVDVETETRHIQEEDIESALVASIQQLAAGIPQMAAQGMDVSVPLQQISKILELRSKGKSLAEAVTTALAPPEPETPAENTAEGGQEEQPGTPPGAAPGGPPGDGAPPDLMNLITGLRNGQTVTGANVQRRSVV